MPVTCPKCEHSFDPTIVARAKRKPVRREAPEGKKDVVLASVLATRKPGARKKDKKSSDDEGSEGGIGAIAEMEDMDDIENLKDLSELEEMEETPVNQDDADDEAIIENMNTGDKPLVGNVEDEENAMGDEDEEEDEAPRSLTQKKANPKKKLK
jgi:hypothetical protein